MPGTKEVYSLFRFGFRPRVALEVRRSYVREVLEGGRDEAHEQAWMLRQPDAVRHSYIDEVLGVER